MPRLFKSIASSSPRLFLAALPIWATFFGTVALSGQAPQRQVLKGHVPEAVARLQTVAPLPATNSLRLAVGLPFRNKSELAILLNDLYDPASPNFHHFLTSEEFTARFGPAERDAQTVIAFLQSNGFFVREVHPNRALVVVEGPVAAAENAFHVRMGLYQHPSENRYFYAPDTDPSVEAGVPVLHVSGLDNFTLPHPKHLIRKPAGSASRATPATGSAPSGNYMGNDFRAAYVPGVSLTGAGQAVALVQFDGYYPSDIASYESQAGLPNVTLTNIYLDGYTGTPTSAGNDEVSLDIEMTISMAPGLSRVILYEAGPSGNPDELLNTMAADNLAKQISCSWGWGGGPDSSADQSFQQMAAQGQSFFDASGDSDAITGNTSSDFPADDPYITQVGGTTLTTSGAGGSWVSETVWNWGGGTGSSGGISTLYPIQSWQQGISMSANGGSTTMRNFPDVALTADNVWVIYGNGKSGEFGGTSCASPLWAAFTALVNQQARSVGKPCVGFLNPALYAIGKGPGYSSDFHDITTGNNFNSSSPSKFSAVAGYDLCTGWGAPNGANLINALAPLANVPQVVSAGYALVAPGCFPTNGAINPGETVQVSFAFQNIGLANTTNLVVTLLATNGVASPSGAQSYGVLSTNGTVVSQVFTFTAQGTCGGAITPTLQLQDGAANFGTVSLPMTLGAMAASLSQNFDAVAAPALPSGWATSASGAESPWVTSTTDADTPPNAAFSPDPSSVGINELDSPPVALPASGAQLSFRHSYALEAHPSSTTGYDGGVLEISIAGGAYTDILAAGGSFVTGGYDHTISSRYGSPLAGRQAWSGSSGGFITTVVNPPPSALGQTVRFRWRCGTDAGNDPGNWTGWYIDTIAVSGSYTCCTPTVADLAIGQSFSPALVELGTPASLTFNVTNFGPNAANNVVVTDAIPAGLTFLSAALSQGTWETNNGVFSADLGALDSGATASITLLAQTVAAGAWTNAVAVASSASDPNPANNNASAVLLVNPPPSISSISNIATIENMSVGPVPFTIGDEFVPLSALTLTAASSNTNLISPANIVFGGSGANPNLTLAPAPNQFGSATITVTVSDGLAGANASFAITVNSPPTLAPIAAQTMLAGRTLALTAVAGDPDGDPLTFSLGPGAPPNASIGSASGAFTFTPDNSQIGTNQFSVVVTDQPAVGPSLSATQSFSVIVVSPSHALTLMPLSNAVIVVGITLTVSNAAADIFSPPASLTFSLAPGAATNAGINPSTGLFNWTPVDAQLGTNAFSVIAMDNQSPPLSATQSFLVTVVSTNDLPSLAPISDQMIYASTALVIGNSGSIGNGDKLAFSLGPGAPSGTAIDPDSGLFTWTPADAQGGTTNLISVEVTDESWPNLSAEQSFTVSVLARPQIIWLAWTNDAVQLAWTAIAGQIYRVQYKSDVEDTNWADLAPDVLAGSSTASQTDSVPSFAQRFYRVLLLP